MNITELRYLVAIMECGSVSAAAKRLYAAQPNVSKALKNLEEEYGLRIFERSSTGMIPTEQGKRFIRQAQRVLQQVDELKQEAHQQRSCAELRVVLTHATYASYAAVDFLQQAARSEQLRVHIRESGAIEALDFVLRQGYHIALLRYAAEDEALTDIARPAAEAELGEVVGNLLAGGEAIGERGQNAAGERDVARVDLDSCAGGEGLVHAGRAGHGLAHGR